MLLMVLLVSFGAPLRHLSANRPPRFSTPLVPPVAVQVPQRPVVPLVLHAPDAMESLSYSRALEPGVLHLAAFVANLLSEKHPKRVPSHLVSKHYIIVLIMPSTALVQLLVAATPLILWLRVLSNDDHPVLNLVAQEHEKDSRLSSSLPHRCACCAKMLCAKPRAVVSAHTVPHLYPLSSACSCASTSCRSSSHCVSWLSEFSTSLLSANVLRRNTHFRLVL